MKILLKLKIVTSLVVILVTPGFVLANHVPDDDLDLHRVGRSLRYVDCDFDHAEFVGDVTDVDYYDASRDPDDALACNFQDLIGQINIIVEFVAVTIIPSVITLFIAYSGFLYLSAGAMPAQKSKAKGIFTSIIIGSLLFYGAFFIVTTVLNILQLGDNSPFNRFNIEEVSSP